MKAERQKLAEEREQSLQMMRELQALREQLANSAAGSDVTNAAPTKTNDSSANNADSPKEE